MLGRDDLSIDDLHHVLSQTSSELERFTDQVLSKPHDFVSNKVDYEKLSKLISKLESSQQEIERFMKVRGPSKVKMADNHIKRIFNAIQTMTEQLTPESAIEQVAITTIVQLQSSIQHMSFNDTTWLKRGQKIEKADMEGFEGDKEEE